MITHLHDFSLKLIPKLAPSVRHILEKLVILLIPLPLFMLFAGTEGIIENDSPENLATLGSLGSSFFDFFGLHTLIIAGAFGITFIIWFVTKNIWVNIDEEPFRDNRQENTVLTKEKIEQIEE